MRPAIVAVVIAVAAVAGACESSPDRAPEPTPRASSPSRPAAASAAKEEALPTTVDPADLKSFKPVPARFESPANPITEAKVALGRMLYFEPRLSKNHDVSCNSCHDLAAYGVDNKPRSPGHKGQLGGRNSPTVYNAGGHVAQFWDGRAATLEDQAKGPILNPIEMAMPDEKRVVAVLASIPGYQKAFKEAFPTDKKPISYDNLAKAIGAFERQLVTPSRFDKYLAGDATALTQVEITGFATFVKVGCTTCHTGAAVGGTTFQKLGLVKPYPGLEDKGRFDATKDDRDRFYFRVPSLRNIDKTGPYFHDGSLETLDVVVRKMAWHQLGIELQDRQADVIVAFLKSLTGEIPTEYVKPPELPPSGPTTPKPDPS